MFLRTVKTLLKDHSITARERHILQALRNQNGLFHLLNSIYKLKQNDAGQALTSFLLSVFMVSWIIQA